MKTSTIGEHAAVAPSLIDIFLAESWCEFLKALRQPAFVVPSLFFPVAFYSLFGVALGGGRGPDVAAYMLATYGIFGAIGPALFGFGIGISNERELGWLNIKRAAPVPSALVLASKLAMAMIFAAIISLMLFAVAAGLAHVRLPITGWLSLLGLNLIATLPFGLIGLTIGLKVKAQGTAAITNIVFLGMSVLGGLWMPLNLFPSVVQKLALTLPTYHMANLSLAAIGQRTLGSTSVDPVISLAFIAAFSGIFFAIAVGAWRALDSDR